MTKNLIIAILTLSIFLVPILNILAESNNTQIADKIQPPDKGREVSDMIPEDLREEFFKAAEKTANWLVANQVQSWPDANNGRLLYTYTPATGDYTYSDNWTTGVSIMGLLMMYHRTGDEKFKEAAILAGGYLKTMQILDERDPVAFGAFREITPQYTWCYPRDALTAAWGLLWLHEETGEQDYLYRVNVFIDWFKQNVMNGRWPLWQINFRGDPYMNINMEGSFHGGDGAFFYDYYRVTGDKSHLDDGLKFIADHFLERFLQEDGSLRIVWDREKKEYVCGVDDPQYPLGWQIMHRYNDDFGATTLMNAYLYYGDEKYLEGMKDFAGWLISEQNDDGSFYKKPVAAGSAVAPIELIDLYRITKNRKYLDTAIKAGKHLLTLQETESKEKKMHGGFYGMTDNRHGTREMINLRTTAYALIALLKLEGKEKGPYYSVTDKDGKFHDLRE